MCTVPPNPDLKTVLRCLRAKYGFVRFMRRNPDKMPFFPCRLVSDVEVWFKGKMYTGDIWVRFSGGHPFLCVCRGWKIAKTLCYINRGNMDRIFRTVSSDGQMLAELNRLGKFQASFRGEGKPSVEDLGYEAILSEKELWGDEYWINLIETWGVGALREEADPETIRELYRKGIIDRDDYEWLLGEDVEEGKDAECEGGNM